MKNKMIVLWLVFIFAGVLNAQNSNDALRLSEPGLLSSARALGMGNSLSAVGNDFSSISLNPAGFGLYNNSEIIMSGFINSYNNKTLFYGNSTQDSYDAINLSQFGLVYKVPTSRGSLVLALGYNRTKDFNRLVNFSGYNYERNSMIQDLTSKRSDIAYDAGVSYPITNNMDTTVIDGRLSQLGNTYDEGGIDNWSFAVATEIQKNMFIGGTFSIVSGSFDRKRNYTETDINNIYDLVQTDPADVKTLGFQAFNYFESINWEISGWDLQLGFIYKLKEKTSVGFTIRFPRYINIKETYHLDAAGVFTNYDYTADGGNSKYEYQISTPYEFTFGGAYDAGQFLLSADVKYIDYTQMKFTSGLEAGVKEDINWGIKEDFRKVLNVNLGGEYYLADLGINLRAGFIFMRSPYKNDTPEYDKKIVSCGIGLPMEQMEINIGASYGWWKDFGYNYESATSPVSQTLKSTTLIVSMKYNFF